MSGQPTQTDQIARRFAALAKEVLKVEVDPNDMEARLVEAYGADSMDMMDLTDRAEREFGISIATEDVGAVRTFGDFVNCVAKHF